MNIVVAAMIGIGRPDYLRDSGLSECSDSGDYLCLGHNVLLHGQFSRSTSPPYRPDMVRTPVYPIFAGGLDLLGGAAAIYAAQVALHAAGCVFLYFLVEAVFGARAALWSSCLYAVDLVVATSNYWVMAETLFVFLVLSSFTLVLPEVFDAKRRLSPSRWKVPLGGSLLGLAILTRPAGLYLPWIVAVAIAGIGLIRRQGLGATFLTVATFLLASLLPVGAWMARNAAVFSLPRLTSVDAIDLVYFVGAGPYQLKHSITRDEASRRISEEFGILTEKEATDPQIPGTVYRTEAEIDAQLRPMIPKILARHPLLLAECSTLGVLKASISHSAATLAAMGGATWNPPGMRDLLRLSPDSLARLRSNGAVLVTVFVWEFLQNVLGIALAVIGLAFALRSKATRVAGLVLMAVLGYQYLTVAIFGMDAYWRCRVPVMPVLYVFAGLGLHLVLTWRQKAQQRSQCDVDLEGMLPA